MRSYDGFTLESCSSERHSLINYIGVKENLVTQEKLLEIVNCRECEPVIIIARKLSIYEKCIDASKRSIILIHRSDEHYDTSYVKIYRHKNVVCIVRNYHVFPVSILLCSLLTWPFAVARWIAAYGMTLRPVKISKSHIMSTLRSLPALVRQMRFAYAISKKGRERYCYLPLNETDFFVSGQNDLVAGKNVAVSFAGSVHSRERIVALHSARELGVGHGYDGWGWLSENALSSKDYVSMLASSRFVLTPVGHTNQDSFRFYEAIRANSLPLIAKKSPWQPFPYYSLLYNVDSRLLLPSFKKKEIRRAIASINEYDYKCLLDCLKESVRNRNWQAREHIANFMCQAARGDVR